MWVVNIIKGDSVTFSYFFNNLGSKCASLRHLSDVFKIVRQTKKGGEKKQIPKNLAQNFDWVSNSGEEKIYYY